MQRFFGDDVLTGGAGDDILDGHGGGDTYRFNLGDGEDIVDDNGSTGTDVISCSASHRRSVIDPS